MAYKKLILVRLLELIPPETQKLLSLKLGSDYITMFVPREGGNDPKPTVEVFDL